MGLDIQQLERQLDRFDLDERRAALAELIKKNRGGQVATGRVSGYVNIHIHTFYGYNAYNYSPSKAAWLAYKHGLAFAGIIDFDVLDGLDEFLDAAKLINIKACVGIETRVYVPEYTHQVINSPGEPGIAYHIGIGIPHTLCEKHLCDFLKRLKNISHQRNVELASRVNKFLDPLIVDFDKEVLPLTPKGNATERHLCEAYAIKAEKIFRDKDNLVQFWMRKLDCPAAIVEVPYGPTLLGEIRKKTMKKGSIGYVQPDKGSFPTMAEMNKFILEAGGIPTLCWLDGISEGEQDEEKLIEVAMNSGVRAFSVIPNPIYTPNDPQKKLENLHKIVKLVDSIGLPIVSGTEMNNYGQSFVDDFTSEGLAPLAPIFLKGARIIYAHSVMQRQAGWGYMSRWTEQNFKNPTDKNRFFERVGEVLTPDRETLLSSLRPDPSPEEILSVLRVL